MTARLPSRSPIRGMASGLAALLLVTTLGGCASGPKAPDWQSNARSAVDDAVQDTLLGDSRAERSSLARARAEISRTGDPALMARAELMHCAAQVASLEFGACPGYQPLAADAAPAERAYAAYLGGQRLSAGEIELLPPAQREAARAVAAGTAPAAAALQSLEDPLSRLIACAVLLQAGQARPEVMAAAAETASAQGWRRPLLGWLNLLQLRAQKAGDAAEAARLGRRIAVVEGALPSSAPSAPSGTSAASSPVR